MNDKIRPPMPANSPGGSSRETINREQGRGSELTSTVVTQEGKLGILLNKQFLPLAIALDAKVGDIVRVRVEQVGKENSVRVLRILETLSDAPAAAPAAARTLRDLFPSEAIRPLQELFISLQEVMDVTTADEVDLAVGSPRRPSPLSSPAEIKVASDDLLSVQTAGEFLEELGEAPPLSVATAPRGADAAGDLPKRTEVSPQQFPPFGDVAEAEPLEPAGDRGTDPQIPLAPRPFPLPSAYGPPPPDRQTIVGPQTPQSTAVLPLSSARSSLLSFAQTVVSSLSAAFIEPPLVTNRASSPREAITAFLDQASTRVSPSSSPAEAELAVKGSNTVQGKEGAEQQALLKTGVRVIEERTQQERHAPILEEPDETRSTSHRASALRFHQAVSDAQPTLERYSRLFESLNQPSYLLSSILIGAHIIPLELSTFIDSSTVDRPEEEGGSRSSAHPAFSRVRMTIYLPTLGSVGIDIAYRQSEVLLKFSSASSEVTQFLSAQLPSFSKELEDEGFHLVSWFAENAKPPSIAPLWFQDLVAGEIVA